MAPVDILILGVGWTSTFLIPLLNDRGLAFKGTTRDGRKTNQGSTIKFDFQQDRDTPESFATLPSARCVVITFPIYGSGGSERLVRQYRDTHSDVPNLLFAQLGSTGIWDASYL
jgi:hypothetical protein